MEEVCNLSLFKWEISIKVQSQYLKIYFKRSILVLVKVSNLMLLIHYVFGFNLKFMPVNMYLAPTVQVYTLQYIGCPQVILRTTFHWWLWTVVTGQIFLILPPSSYMLYLHFLAFLQIIVTMRLIMVNENVTSRLHI